MLTLYEPRKKEKCSIHLQLTFGTRFASFLFFEKNLHQTFYAIQNETGTGRYAPAENADMLRKLCNFPFSKGLLLF
jgi:hypothetical protein